MNGYVAKCVLVCLFCLVICANSQACTPIDIYIYYHWSYVTYGTYDLSLDAYVASGGPAVTWAWYFDSGLAYSGAYSSEEGWQDTAYGIGSATPGVYTVSVTAWNLSGCFDSDYAYVIVCPTVQIGESITKLLRAYPGGGPDVTFTATGLPSGGTYFWDEFNMGTGIVTLTNTTTPTVTVHPSCESSVPGGDVDLQVTYTYNGATMTVGKFLTIVIPQKTTSAAGKVTEPTEWTWQRWYYHGLIDQLDEPMVEPQFIGIAADESVWWEKGSRGWAPPRPGDYGNCAPDGDFYGGLAIPDQLGANKRFGWALYGQSITAGVFSTTPQYTITWDTVNESDPVKKE